MCSTCVSTQSGQTGCFPPAHCLLCVHRSSHYCLATLYDLKITHALKEILSVKHLANTNARVDWRVHTVMVLLNKYLNHNHDWLAFAQVLVSVLLSYNENNVRGCHISSGSLWYELIMHTSCHLVHHILPQDKSMALIHQCTYKYCTQHLLWWNDAYHDNLVQHLGSRRSLSPKIKQQQDHMTVIVSRRLHKHPSQRTASWVPCQPLPVLTANDHNACDEKKACNWQSDDAQGLIVCNNNNNTHPRMYQVESEGKRSGQMSHRSWSLYPI